MVTLKISISESFAECRKKVYMGKIIMPDGIDGDSKHDVDDFE